MVNRTKNLFYTMLTMASVIGAVEYFKIWARDNYDFMHCYTRVHDVGSGVFQITVNGTTSCDVEAQELQISKKLGKQPGEELWFCVNKDEAAEKVIDKVVGYFGEDELALNEYCAGEIKKVARAATGRVEL